MDVVVSVGREVVVPKNSQIIEFSFSEYDGGSTVRMDFSCPQCENEFSLNEDPYEKQNPSLMKRKNY